MQGARYWPLLALALLLPVWSIGLFDRGIWTPDEPREYDIAFNMLQSGDLIVPRLAGEPFLEKPPLAYWLQSASMRVLGPSIAAARLPNLLYAALVVLCIGMLAGDLAGERHRSHAAFIAAVVCATMSVVLQAQIWLATDAALIAMTATALLSIWRLAHAEEGWRRQLGWSLLLGASLAGAVLAKNASGLLVPGLTILGWLAWERRLQQLLHWRWWAAAGLLMLLAGGWLLALAQQPGGRGLLQALLWDNVLARFAPVQVHGNYDLGHRSAHWPFLLLLPVYVIPWTFAVLAAARWGIRSLRNATPFTSAIRFGIVATVPAYILLLVSRTARGVYFAPVLLSVPILVALWLMSIADHATDSEPALLRLTRRTLLVLAGVFAVAAALVAALTRLQDVSAIALTAPIAVVVAIRLCLRATPRSSQPVLAAIGVFLLALTTLQVLAFPAINRSQGLGSLVAAAGPQLKSRPVALYCGDETIRATLDYTIGLRPQNVCSIEAAADLLAQRDDQQFLVQLARPRSAQRMTELFPSLHAIYSKIRSPRKVRRVADLEGMGLQQTAHWSVPGGRKYALYGRAPADAAPTRIE